MPLHRRRSSGLIAAGCGVALFVAACAGPSTMVEQARQQVTAAAHNQEPPGQQPAGRERQQIVGVPDEHAAADPRNGESPAAPSAGGDQPPAGGDTAPAGGNTPAPFDPDAVTVAFAGDVNFAERTADRLAADPATAFGAAAATLGAADLTVINLETAITTGGDPEPKSFTFRAPPSAFTALRAAGVDVASMANNHGADYGATGLQDSLAAIAQSQFPVIGIGGDDAAALAPYRASIDGMQLAVFAASAVHDHTLEAWTATADTPGIASAFDPRLSDAIGAEAAAGRTVVVFLHWGTEYDSCPDADQEQLADQFSAAGASAIVGTHAHVLQGAGWRADGTYVAYGLSNYLWWRSFGNEQDDNGVLTLTFEAGKVTGAHFAPSHLDDTGVPVPAAGTVADRILAEWEQVRQCTDLASNPPN